VQARATLEFVQALQTSTAQALYAAEWQTTVQARQRKKLNLHGRPVYPLPTHYRQTWQHLPDYGVYHATLIADPALPGKWQPGEEVIYLLVFQGAEVNASE
jgi:hypothetical protein